MSIDLSVLYFFNQTLASSVLDVLVNILTNVHYWYPVYVIGGVWFIVQSDNRPRAIWIVVGAIITVAFSDSLAHYLIKPLVHRARPCTILPDGRPLIEWLRLPIGRKLDPSFPSSHALNNMAVASYFCWRVRGRSWWLFPLAIVIGLGRLYEGVHYPSDVFGGYLIGAIVGMAIAMVTMRFQRRVL